MKENESLGIILFNTKAINFHTLKSIKITDIDNLIDSIKGKEKNNLLDIKTNGGTNMAEPLQYSIKLMENYIKEEENKNKNNRIIFLTDANPNNSETKDLISLTKSSSKEKIYTTFIGVGLDFNSIMVEEISKGI
jgi:Ca-activated chloride channel family protein